MSPPVVNPSYWMPTVFAALARFTSDGRWQQATTTAVTLLGRATDDGRSLPTDWATLSDGRLSPIPHPNGNLPLQYGLDAARLPLWLGTACPAGPRDLAARWWHNTLSTDDRAADLALSPDGTPIDRETNALSLLAAAAAARAAGDSSASRALRGRAEEQSRNTPTYYGDAWLAIGSALLDHSLDPCREADDG
jgi:endoglucanase